MNSMRERLAMSKTLLGKYFNFTGHIFSGKHDKLLVPIFLSFQLA